MNEVKGVASYKSRQDLTIEDISIFKGKAERDIELILIDLENTTGLDVKYIGTKLTRDDLNNPLVEISLNI